MNFLLGTVMIMQIVSGAPLEQAQESERIYFPGENPENIGSRSYGGNYAYSLGNSASAGGQMHHFANTGVHHLQPSNSYSSSSYSHMNGQQAGQGSFHPHGPNQAIIDAELASEKTHHEPHTQDGQMSLHGQHASAHHNHGGESGQQFHSQAHVTTVHKTYGRPLNQYQYQVHHQPHEQSHMSSVHMNHYTEKHSSEADPLDPEVLLSQIESGKFTPGKYKFGEEHREHHRASEKHGSEVDPLNPGNILNDIQNGKFTPGSYKTGENRRQEEFGPKELSYILNEQSNSTSEHKLHPNIKQALDNIMKDMEEITPERTQPVSQAVHNIGREDNHIQTTKYNDNINLSQLINELHQLEQSPSHRNITWCEEKIKEFLRALRRKQDSGVYITEEVQEQTLHQILTQDNTLQQDDQEVGVEEPIFEKHTIHPIGATEATKQHNAKEGHHSISMESVSSEESSHGASKEHTSHTSYSETHHISQASKEHEPQNEGDYEHHLTSHEISYSSNHQQSPLISQSGGDSANVATGVSHISHEVDNTQTDMSPKDDRHSEEITNENTNSNENHQELQSNPQQEQLNNYEGSYHATNQEEQNTESQETKTEDQEMHHEKPKQEESFPIDPNTPEGFQPRPAGQLDLELPEYPFETNHNPSQNDLSPSLGQLNLDQPEPESVVPVEVQHSQHQIHRRPEAPEEELQNTEGNAHQQSESHKEISTSHHETPEGNAHQQSESHEEISISHHETPKAPQTELVIQDHQKDASAESQEEIVHNEKETHHSSNSSNNDLTVDQIHKQEGYYDALIEELVQLESLPGHQAIDKCEDKIREFLEILKYQQEQGFSKNQHELERLNQALIEQAQRYKLENQNNNGLQGTPSPESFWRRVQKTTKKAYENLKNQARKKFLEK